ncbi:hypothetical protein F5Y15DRAFT_429522 [Xylariaceae sp. FL0016]|nr:hypothetical protein F5Y15DRAFT_429522 [Xylariaceae sp. FL0016]
MTVKGLFNEVVTETKLSARCFLSDITRSKQGAVVDTASDIGEKHLPLLESDISAIRTICKAAEVPIRTFFETAWALSLAQSTNTLHPCFGILASGSTAESLRISYIEDDISTFDMLEVVSSQRQSMMTVDRLLWSKKGEPCFNTAITHDADIAWIQRSIDVLLIIEIPVPGVTLRWKTTALRTLSADRILRTYVQLIKSMAAEPHLPVQRQQFSTKDSIKRATLTETQLVLRDLWMRVLRCDSESIGPHSHFIRLGGDSIRAMKLAALAREGGISLNVHTILGTPVLSDMAAILEEQRAKDHPESNYVPFSMLPASSRKQLVEEGSRACNLDPRLIEDVYPCTSLQVGFMSESLRQAGTYIGQFLFDVPPHMSMQQYKRVWETLVQETPILRTRIFMSGEGQMLQLVAQENVLWRQENQENDSMGIGEPLCHLTVCQHNGTEAKKIALRIHHAIYDGWSMRVLAKHMDDIYYRTALTKNAMGNFGAFVRHTQTLDQDSMTEFWGTYLEGAKRTALPTAGGPDRRGEPNSYHSRFVPLRRGTSLDVTPSVLIYIAWAIVLHHWCEEEEVTLQTTLTGRSVDLPSIENIAGPTITNIPVRVRLYHEINGSRQGIDLQIIKKELESFFTDVIPYQHFGIQNIQRLSPDTRKCCDFNNLIVIHPESDIKHGDSIFASHHQSKKLEGMHSYALALNCDLVEDGVQIGASYDSRLIGNHQIDWMLRQMEYVITFLLRGNFHGSVDDIDLVGDHEVGLIRSWNSSTSVAVDDCAHKLVNVVTQRQPEASAIDGWDCQLTYSSLMSATDRLASELVSLGVEPDQFIPLAFHKSAWTIVAMLAVQKAGAAFVLLDMALPYERLQLLIDKVKATIVIAGQSAIGLCPPVKHRLILSAETLGKWPMKPEALSRVRVAPENAAYIMFTSGSTGEPKGCILSHRSLCTSATGTGKALSMGSMTRSLQFSSYSFAACIVETLTVLINGGCVCVPSDAERMNDVAGAIKRRSVNWAFMTASVLSVIDPESVPTLKGLSMGGEAVRAEQIASWADRVDLQQGYGSAECCGIVVSNSLTPSSSPNDVGRPKVGRCWLVDPQDPNKLAPLGCEGEIIIESATVGRGYLNEQAKTAAAFINPPDWRKKIGSLPLGNRFYKTGDIGRYNSSDGLLQFLGRRDMQIKLHGQRIELGEIEHNMKKSLPPGEIDVAVELIVPRNALKEDALLVAFLGLGSQFEGPEELHDLSQTMRDWVARLATDVTKALKTSVAEYMIPSSFIPLKKLPLTLSGKLYRKGLRELGHQLTVQELKTIGEPSSAPAPNVSTQAERDMRRCWSQVLGLEEAVIRADSNFMHLGGDSLSAMRLVKLARGCGLALDLNAAMSPSTLSTLAAGCRLQTLTKVHPTSVPVMNHIPPRSNKARNREAMRALDSRVEPESVYPALQSQIDLLILSTVTPGKYTAQYIIKPKTCSLSRIQDAWEHVVMETPILRSRIVVAESNNSLQVVLPERVRWFESENLDAYLEEDSCTAISFGDPLVRSCFARDPRTGAHVLVLTLHHAVYDGFSLPLLMSRLQQYIEKGSIRHAPSLEHYVHKINEPALIEQARLFWTTYFRGFQSTRFPLTLSDSSTNPRAHFMDQWVARRPTSGFNLACVLYAAWFLIQWQYTGDADVVVGTVSSGRNIEMDQVHEIIGLLANAMPMRTKIEEEETVAHFLRKVQRNLTDISSYGSLGLGAIKSLTADAAAASKFNTLFVVHPQHELDSMDAFQYSVANEGKMGSRFYQQPLSIECKVSRQHSIGLDIHYDSAVISHKQVEVLSRRFRLVSDQLLQSSSDTFLRDISFTTPKDMRQLLALNEEVALVQPELVAPVLDAYSSDSQMLRGRVWITSPWNTHQLRGIDSVGEICIELEESLGAESSQSVPNPFWVTNSPIEVGSVYRTGLMGRLTADGSVVRLQDLPSVVAGEMLISQTESKYLPAPEEVAIAHHPKKTRQTRCEAGSNIVCKSETKNPDVAVISGDLQALAAVWAKSLRVGIEDVSQNDNFFDKGGDSLKVMALVSNARKAGLTLLVRDVYDSPVLRDLAEKCGRTEINHRRNGSSNHTEPARLGPGADDTMSDPSHFSIEETLPCLPLQLRMVNTMLSTDKGLLYYYRISAAAHFDIGRLKFAWTTLIRRHSILRSMFVAKGSEIVQSVLRPFPATIALREVDDVASQAASWITGDRQSFHLFDGPILKLVLFYNSRSNSSELIIRLSHAQFDGGSFPILMQEFQDLYSGFDLAPAPSFSSFVRASLQMPPSVSKKYWNSVLGSTKESLLVHHSQPSTDKRYNTYIHRRLPRALLEQHGPQPLSRILAASWALTLASLLQLDDLIFGELVSNRRVMVDGVEAVLGPCINVIPTRVSLAQKTYRDVVSDLKSQAITRIPFESTPPSVTMAGRSPWASQGRFSSVVAYQDVALNDYVSARSSSKACLRSTQICFRLGGTDCQILWEKPAWDMADVAVMARPCGSDINIELIFSSRLLPEDAMSNVLDVLTASFQKFCSVDALDEQISLEQLGAEGARFPLRL